jgi:RNA polymerase sigma-70 factor (ECF subfamily)
VVRNACADMLRKKQSFVSLDEADEPAEPFSDSETREEALREVERLMDERLSPLQRRVMEMREYAGLAVADIARRLDMQETAVRMNLSRARQALREMMKHSENR